MFFGSVRLKIDERGALTLPQQWREELGSSPILTQSVDRCLCVFPRDKFERIVDEADQLGIAYANVRRWTRFLTGPATELETGRSGIIEIPQDLRGYADLNDEVDLVGVASRIEIWNPARHQEWESSDAAQMGEIAERVGKLIRSSKQNE